MSITGRHHHLGDARPLAPNLAPTIREPIDQQTDSFEHGEPRKLYKQGSDGAGRLQASQRDIRRTKNLHKRVTLTASLRTLPYASYAARLQGQRHPKKRMCIFKTQEFL